VGLRSSDTAPMSDTAFLADFDGRRLGHPQRPGTDDGRKRSALPCRLPGLSGRWQFPGHGGDRRRWSFHGGTPCRNLLPGGRAQASPDRIEAPPGQPTPWPRLKPGALPSNCSRPATM
jgi:hypothetical protein